MSKDITIIAFVGKKKSGKTTARKYLVERYDYVPMRFASVLKDMLCTFGLTTEEVDGELKELPCKKLGGKTPVQAMQTLGTEWGRDCMYQNIWVDAFDRGLQYFIEKGLTRFVIDDLRFMNEYAYLSRLREKYNVIVIRMEREGTVVGEHRSETEMDRIHPNYILCNYDSVEKLYKNVDSVMSICGNGKFILGVIPISNPKAAVKNEVVRTAELTEQDLLPDDYDDEDTRI